MTFTGCAALKADIAKMEVVIENVNYNDLLSYWQAFVKGLKFLLPIIEAVFPGTTKTDTIIGAALDKADASVTALATGITEIKAGTMTSDQAKVIAAQVQKDVVAASNLIGQAVGIAKAQPVKAPAAVPTK
jgi:hypothetical protein